MAEQLVDYGVCIGFEPTNGNFAIISDGYFTIRAFINTTQQVQIGKSYHVYKKGTTYYVGTEVTT
jgi:hypothetical protein